MKNLVSICLLIACAEVLRSAELKSVSTSDSISQTAAGHSSAPDFGGGRILFVSAAKNLVEDRAQTKSLNIFSFDPLTGSIELISSDAFGLTGNANSTAFRTSRDGRYVVFASEASNLVTGDTNRAPDIFLGDLPSGTIRLVSADLALNPPPNPNTNSALRPLSANGEVSESGRWCVFESYATNLVELLKNGDGPDIFVRDMLSNVTSLVSVTSDGASTSSSHDAHITPNGRFVAFVSSATNLVSPPSPNNEHLFRRDLEIGQTAWLSKAIESLGPRTDSYPGNYQIADHTMSDDGSVLVYKLVFPTLPFASVYRYSLSNDESRLLTTNAYYRSAARLSPDGRFIAYEDGSNVVVWDDALKTNILASYDASNSHGASGISHSPALSSDGRYVSFLSSATDIATNSVSGDFQIYWRDLQAGITRLVSRSTNGSSSTANHEFIVPSISSDGLSVVFESEAADLVENDANEASDIFLYDSAANSLRAVSVAGAASPARLSPEFGGARRNALSADGRLVAYYGYELKAPPWATNRFSSVFVRDLSTGTNISISLETNSISNVEISGNGRYLTYNRRKRLGSVFHYDDLLRHDLLTGESRFLLNAPAPNSRFAGAAAHMMNFDGSIVAYEYQNSPQQIYISDFNLGTNYLASRRDDFSTTPVLTPDGSKLFFIGSSQVYMKVATNQSPPFLAGHTTNKSEGLPMVANAIAVAGNSQMAAFAGRSGANRWIYRYDIPADATSLICSSCQNPTLDSGKLMAYETVDDFGIRTVVLRDLETGQTTTLSDPASLNLPPGTPLDSWSPVITDDARFILFLSRITSSATNVTRLYVRDRVMNQTLLLTPNAEGIGLVTGDGAQLGVSRDGRTAVFRSFASDLVSGDYNDTRDVFIVRLGSGDSDGDGMDDDWEIAFFGNLNRNGLGDFDGDGQSDLQEFRAGTDPTNSGSVLRAITVTPLNGKATVLWNAVSGRSYRVEYKENADDPSWTLVSGEVRINGSTGSMEDPGSSADTHRFYRVAVLR